LRAIFASASESKLVTFLSPISIDSVDLSAHAVQLSHASSSSVTLASSNDVYRNMENPVLVNVESLTKVDANINITIRIISLNQDSPVKVMDMLLQDCQSSHGSATTNREMIEKLMRELNLIDKNLSDKFKIKLNRTMVTSLFNEDLIRLTVPCPLSLSTPSGLECSRPSGSPNSTSSISNPETHSVMKTIDGKWNLRFTILSFDELAPSWSSSVKYPGIQLIVTHEASQSQLAEVKARRELEEDVRYNENLAKFRQSNKEERKKGAKVDLEIQGYLQNAIGGDF